MKIEIVDKKKKDTFISIFNLLKNASTQINVNFTKEKLHIQGMDKSHVCLYNLFLDNKWFHTYEVSSEDGIKLCFGSPVFCSIISTKSDDQSLIFKYNEYIQEDNLHIEFVSGEKKGEYNKYFIMPLHEYEYEEMIIPEVDYDAEMILPAKKITDILSQLSRFGDDINVVCTEDYVDFKTKDTSGEMRVNISVDDMESYSIVENETIDLVYSLVYIDKMCITNKLSDEIEFSLSQEYPMKIKYDLGEDSHLMYYIAPKLSDN